VYLAHPATLATVRHRVATFSLLFAWVCAHGAIWDAVQVFAWGKMFAGYAGTMNVAAALRETFDPTKPCDMCLGVANAKETAKQQLPQSVERSAEKLLLALHTPARVVFENSPEAWPAALASAGAVRSESVPVPPPRV
jgi:hypothetical protein